MYLSLLHACVRWEYISALTHSLGGWLTQGVRPRRPKTTMYSIMGGWKKDTLAPACTFMIYARAILAHTGKKTVWQPKNGVRARANVECDSVHNTLTRTHAHARIKRTRFSSAASTTRGGLGVGRGVGVPRISQQHRMQYGVFYFVF